jgi:hypothetical protein
MEEAWLRISGEWNLWITNIRNHYGKVQVLKFPQAFPDPAGKAYGYPHIHALLLFQDANFSVFPHFKMGDDGLEHLDFRIHEKDELHDQGKWHSWIDVQALRSMSAAANYCRKYAQGTCNVVSDSGEVNEESLLSCSIQWFYGKQSYSLSGGFQASLSDLIAALQGSKTFQCRIDGGDPIPLWSWEFLGIRGAAELLACGLDPPGQAREIEDPDLWEKIVRRSYVRERYD